MARGAGDLYFCGSCHNILPADAGHDYFALLGCARAFDLSPPQLELAFKEAQRTLHPDKFCTRPEARGAGLSFGTAPRAFPHPTSTRWSSATPPHRLPDSTPRTPCCARR